MKNNAIRMFLAAGAACVIGTALYAQSHELSAKVPFAFQVANTTMAPGNYRIGDFGTTGVLVLKSVATGNAVFIGGATHTLDPVRPGRMVFHCYGSNACFLAEVWPVTGRGTAVARSKAEKEILKNEHSREMAAISIDIRADD